MIFGQIMHEELPVQLNNILGHLHRLIVVQNELFRQSSVSPLSVGWKQLHNSVSIVGRISIGTTILPKIPTKSFASAPPNVAFLQKVQLLNLFVVMAQSLRTDNRFISPSAKKIVFARVRSGSLKTILKT